MPSFQRPESARLVDFLDESGARSPSRLSPVYETDTKVLNATSATEDTSLRCLRKLQAIFSHCHLRTSFPVISLESVVIPLPPVVFPTCGRAHTMTSECASLSKRLTSPANILEGPMFCFEFVACLAHSCVREAFTMTSLSAVIYWSELVRVLIHFGSALHPARICLSYTPKLPRLPYIIITQRTKRAACLYVLPR